MFKIEVLEALNFMLVYFILLKGQCKHLKHIRHLSKDIFHHVTAMSFKTLGHVMLNVCILEISIPVSWNFFWLELSSGNSNLGTYLYFLQKRTTCILHIMSKCLVWIGIGSSSILNLHNSSINYCKTSFVLNSKTYFINAVFFLLHTGDGSRVDSSFGHEPEPVVVRGGRR